MEVIFNPKKKILTKKVLAIMITRVVGFQKKKLYYFEINLINTVI